MEVLNPTAYETWNMTWGEAVIFYYTSKPADVFSAKIQVNYWSISRNYGYRQNIGIIWLSTDILLHCLLAFEMRDKKNTNSYPIPILIMAKFLL
jgi:hypothetical protein